MLFSSWLRTLKDRFQLPPGQRARLTRRKPRQRAPLRVEILEDRTVLSTFTVTTTADNGDNTNPVAGSLRWAINQVNADQTDSSTNPDTIAFNITAASDAAGGGTGYNATTGVATILPQIVLPTDYNPVIIDGYTQGQGTTLAASPNTLPLTGSNAGDNAVQKIILDGSNISSQVDGLAIAAGGGTVQGLVIQNFSNDIHLTTRALSRLL